jgi:hypothetical protein
MKFLIACEESQRVCTALRALGFEAYSCDILPCSGGHPEWHIQDDVLNHLDGGFDCMIGHPECRFLTITGNKWFKPEFVTRFPDRKHKREQAKEFFMKLVNAPIRHIAIENPVGVMSTCYRKPDQYIQPFQFGHPTTKKTGLWLKNLPKLKPTKIVEPQFYIAAGKRYSATAYMSKRALNHLDYLPPSPERSRLRSRTFEGIAEAMANQWGNFVINGGVV